MKKRLVEKRRIKRRGQGMRRFLKREQDRGLALLYLQRLRIARGFGFDSPARILSHLRRIPGAFTARDVLPATTDKNARAGTSIDEPGTIFLETEFAELVDQEWLNRNVPVIAQVKIVKPGDLVPGQMVWVE